MIFKKTKFTVLKFIYFLFETPNKYMMVLFQTRLGKILNWRKFSGWIICTCNLKFIYIKLKVCRYYPPDFIEIYVFYFKCNFPLLKLLLPFCEGRAFSLLFQLFSSSGIQYAVTIRKIHDKKKPG